MQPFAIFKPGRHTTNKGAELSFADADLGAIAEAYDPAAHEAPIVIGHPAADAPAYGWVKELAFSDGILEATPNQVDSSFAEMVKDGRFKKVSASFYTPDAKANPKPGAHYLRHVGFLGAQPPAVKGLKAVEFAADEEGVVTVEFADHAAADGSVVARIFRGLREWMISKDGVEAADRAIPGYEVDRLQDDATRNRDQPPAFAEPTEKPHEDCPMKAEDIAAKEAEIKAGEEKLAKEKTEFAESQKTDKELADKVTKRESAVAFAEASASLERFVDEGRVPPAHRDRLAALLATLGGDDVEFSEGEGDKAETKKASPKSILMDFLGALPKQIDFTERSEEDGKTLDGADPQATADQAVAFMEEQRGKGIKVSTQAAVRHVLKGAAA